MSATPVAPFDSLAATYDERWTHTPAGMSQRHAVWRQLDPLIGNVPAHVPGRGRSVLDIGCGTGEDAIHFASLGASVLAVDASPEMVARARAKGANAHVLRVEEIAALSGAYDTAVSNFGVLNCVRDLASLREPLERLIRPRGYLAICLLGRFCLWESVYYACRGQFRKASRRWLGATTASLGVRVYYPRVRQIRDALSPRFDLITDIGIGVCVPPSFVRKMSASALRRLDRADQRIAATRWGRVLADHRLLIFRRNS